MVSTPKKKKKKKKKKKQPHTSPKKTTTTTTTTSSTNSPTKGDKKKRNCTVPERLSVKPKYLWVGQPTGNILLKFIEETFTYKGPKLEKLPINDFIKQYDKKLANGQRMAQADHWQSYSFRPILFI